MITLNIMWIYMLIFFILGAFCNKTFKFYLQLVLALTGSAIVATCSIPFLNYKNKTSKNGIIMSHGVIFFCRYILGLQFKKSGIENIINDSGSVIVMNHQSLLDFLAMVESVLAFDNVVGVAKKKAFYMLPFGFIFWAMGTINVNTKKGSIQEELNQTVNTIKNNKLKPFFYPEGTRSNKDQLLPFKKGAFHLAIAAQCPIQPVVISKLKHFDDKSFEHKDIQFAILPPISTKGLTADDVTKLAEDTRTLMQNKFDALNKANV